MLNLCFKIIFFIFSYSFKIFPMNSNKILFIEGMNNMMDLNELMKYLKLQKKFKIYLASKELKTRTYKVINFSSLEFLFHLNTSKYIFSNNGIFSFYPLKREQINIQVWHAAGAFKKFYLNKNNFILNKKSAYNLLTVSSDKVIDIYQEAFGIEREKVKNLGIPRADIFFKANEKLKVKEKFFEKYPELKNKKIIMYAPTFRDNDKGNFKLKLDIQLMKEKLEKSGYVLLLRLHPSIKKDDIKVDSIFSFDFGKYEQVSDLLIVSDILISDYSSIIFEFSIMKKPILFYSYDVEEYIKDRGFYYNYYEFIPNKINYTTEGIIDSIINEEWDLERIERFAKYFFNPFDGNSTERVLKEVGLWEEEK